MKQIILCEGKTDAILISYLLKRQFSWNYIPKSDNLPSFSINRDNETFNWYAHQDKIGQEVAIWGVGGFDEVRKKLRSVVERTQMETQPANRFFRLVVVFDRDERDTSECEGCISTWLSENDMVHDSVSTGKWITLKTPLRKEPPEAHSLHFLCICTSAENNGCLEDFLMECLEQSTSANKALVGEARTFISKISDEPYLRKKRFRSKACLGSILSVISPDWVFSKIDDRLTQVEWERFVQVNDAFGELKEL